MFVENEKVIYKEMHGVIAFICSSYIVIELPAAHPSLRSPRLLVFPENFKNIIHKDHTSK
jgi:hypothetical protein